MKATILYHPYSESARVVEEYAHDFERIHGTAIELVSLETKEGAELAKLYDIIQYPAVLARRDDGELLQHWQGEQLPLMDEVVAQLR
jgi:hypothetical protein